MTTITRRIEWVSSWLAARALAVGLMALSAACGGGDGGGGGRPELPDLGNSDLDSSDSTQADTEPGDADVTDPFPALSLVSPAPDSCVAGVATIVVHANTTGDDLRVVSAVQTYDGFEPGDAPGQWKRQVDLSWVASGWTALTVETISGTADPIALNVWIDVSAPVVQLIQPTAEQLIVGEAWVQFNAFDDSPCNIQSARVEVVAEAGAAPVFTEALDVAADQRVVAEDGAEDGELLDEVQLNLEQLLQFSGIDTGAYTFRVVVTDGVGLESIREQPVDVVRALDYVVGKEIRHSVKTPRAIAAADFDADGIDDVWVAGQSGLAVMRGRGEGNFFPPLPVFVADVYAMHLLDLDQDGDKDLVTVTREAQEFILRAYLLDEGELSPTPDFVNFAKSEPRATAVADLTGDGRPEFIVATKESDKSVGVVLGKDFSQIGVGFGTAVSWSGGVTGAQDMTVDDFNNDAKLDVLVAADGNDKISVFLGTGAGKFLAALDSIVEDDPITVASIRLPGDDLADVIVSSKSKGNLRVQRGTGDGYFDVDLSTASLMVFGATATRVVARDLDGDGQEEIVAAYAGSKTIVVVEDPGNNAEQLTKFLCGPNPIEMAFGQFDQEPTDDLAVLNGGQDYFTLLPGRPGARFAAGRSLFNPVEQRNKDASLLTVAETSGIAFGQFDAVPGLDLAVITEHFNPFGEALNRSYYVYFYSLDGDLPSTTITQSYGLSGKIPISETGTANKGALVGLVTGDFNADGLADLAVGHATTIGNATGEAAKNIDMIVQTSAGEWAFESSAFVGKSTGPEAIVSGSGIVTMAAARFNADLRDDVAVVVPWKSDKDGTYPAEVHTANAYLNQVSSVTAFQPTGVISSVDKFAASNPGTSALLVEDVNRDGLVDLVSVNLNVDSIGFHYGLGTGVFEDAKLSSNVAPNVTVATLQQINPDEDDYPDLVSVGSNQVYVSYGVPGAAGSAAFPFTPPDAAPYPNGKAVSVAAADLNGDGFADLAIADSSRGTLVLYLNIGDRTFATQIIELHTGPQPLEVRAVDLDLDGCVDIVVRERLAMSVFRNAACDR